MTINLLINCMIFLVFFSALPVIVLFAQFLLVGLHGLFNHYSKCRLYTPRVTVIVPAWNEGNVLGNAVDMLMALDYPKENIRICVVDDDSTDHTPEVLKAKAKQYPDKVFHVRRENGGQGKAHTLNSGLEFVLSDNWAEAILIMDADVLFEPQSLGKMTRHLADPEVGAITAYIKEGQIPGNIITRFIAYEYIAAQAASRRSQNVLGVLACLAGGAQLHTRSNIERIGGKINTSTLAEDTYTTFETQLHKYKVIFEGNAIVKAEEPETITDLWKQRFRWSRGNIQITHAFRKVWFHPSTRLGGWFFDLMWFCITLMPFFMILGSIGLVTLFFIDQTKSWALFRTLGGVSAAVYLFITLYSYFIDSETSKRAWAQAIMFPGLISVFLLAVSFAPNLFEQSMKTIFGADNYNYAQSIFLLFTSLWLSMCMFFAWLIYRLDRAGMSRRVNNFLLLLVGYGPFLCAITLAACMAELRHFQPKWDKTEKLGKVKIRELSSYQSLSFEESLTQDIQKERRLFWQELLVFLLILVLFSLRYYFEF